MSPRQDFKHKIKCFFFHFIVVACSFLVLTFNVDFPFNLLGLCSRAGPCQTQRLAPPLQCAKLNCWDRRAKPHLFASAFKKKKIEPLLFVLFCMLLSCLEVKYSLFLLIFFDYLKVTLTHGFLLLFREHLKKKGQKKYH